MRVCLNGRPYQLHRILAKHFLPNPDNLPQVDHIDRNPLNNSIENLRWVSASDTMRNRIVTAYGRYEDLHDPQNDITEITTFNDVEYAENTYFFCFENDQVVQRISDHRWRLSEHRTGGYLRVNMRDTNGRNHMVYVHKIIDYFHSQPADDEQ